MSWKVHAVAWIASAVVAVVGITATSNLDALAVMAFPLMLYMLEWITESC